MTRCFAVTQASWGRRPGESDDIRRPSTRWRCRGAPGALRLGVLAAHEPIKPDGFSDEDAWTLQLAAFAAGLVWQIKASEDRIRTLGDAEAQRLHEHIERTRSMEKMRSDFLKLASHELRGPIAVVRGYFSMMDDKSLDGEALEHAMPIIERKLNEMNALVNEMLETARLEEGLTRLERQPQSLRAIVTAATSAIQPQLSSAHRLDVRLPARTRSSTSTREDRDRPAESSRQRNQVLAGRWRDQLRHDC